MRLKFLARVDYTKKDFFAKFWERLYGSIKNPPQFDVPCTSSNKSPNMSRNKPSSSSEECVSSANSCSLQLPPNCFQDVKEIKDASLKMSTPWPTTLVTDYDRIPLSTFHSSSESTDNSNAVTGASAMENKEPISSRAVSKNSKSQEAKKALRSLMRSKKLNSNVAKK